MHSHNFDDQLSDQSDDQPDLINNAIISDEDDETSSSEKMSEFDQFRNDYGFHVWYFGSPLGIAIADISIAGAKLGGTEALRVLAGGTVWVFLWE